VPATTATLAAGDSRPQTGNRDTAMELIAQSRKALVAGDLVKARQLATQAQNMRPELNWWDDNPEKLLADIQRAENNRGTPTKGSTATASSKPETPRPATSKRPRNSVRRPTSPPARAGAYSSNLPRSCSARLTRHVRNAIRKNRCV
jgi:hypothetical protein